MAETNTQPLSPEPRNPRVSHAAANYVEFVWSGQTSPSYLYDIQIRRAGLATWVDVALGITGRTSYYVDGLNSNTEYEARIRTRIIGSGFLPSEWARFPDFSTFEVNSFSVQAPPQVRVYDRFVNEWLRENDRYVDFNTSGAVTAYLTDNRFAFDAADQNISDIEDSLMVQEPDQIIYGDIPSLFFGNRRVYPGYWDDYLYVFREDDNRAFFSVNRGGSWTEYTMFSDEEIVARWPLDGRGFVDAGDRAGLLGNEYIYSGVNFSGQLRWSSTDVSWSSTSERFSLIEDEFDPVGGGGPVLTWETQWILPEGVDQVASYDINEEWVALADTNGNIWKQSRVEPSTDPETGELEWDPVVQHREDALIRHLTWFGDWLYFLDLGVQTEEDSTPVLDSNSGVWRFDPNNETFEQVLPAEESARVQPSALTRTSDRLIVSLDPVEEEDRPQSEIDFPAPLRRTYESENGTSWLLRNERFSYEAWHQWLGSSEWRLFYSWNREIVAIEPRQEFNQSIDDTSQEFTTTGVHVFTVPEISFSRWPGFATGIAFADTESGALVAFYEFQWRTRGSTTVSFQDDVFIQAELASITRGTAVDVIGGIPVRVNEPKPGVSHLLEKVAPETYIHDTPRFGEFMRAYLRYISDPSQGGYYADISNWIDNQDVNKTAVLDLFETDLSSRNKRILEEDRERFIEFLNNRAQDWWGIRGTIDSYRYLFRVLYDTDVEIDISHKSPVETSFQLLASSEITPDEDLPGKMITSPDRRFYGFVNWVREEISGGQRVWKVVIQGQIGELVEGDRIQTYSFMQEPPTDPDENIAGEAWSIVRGEIPDRDQRELTTRGKSVYNLRIKSGLNTSRWRRNVIEFVHPVGFNLEGVLLLTFLLQAGIGTQAEQTVLDKLLTFTWDMGIPLETPEETAVLDSDGDYVRDSQGNIVTEDNPNGGETITPDSEYYTDNPETFAGLTTEERRNNNSPLFDETLKRFVNFRRV